MSYYKLRRYGRRRQLDIHRLTFNDLIQITNCICPNLTLSFPISYQCEIHYYSFKTLDLMSGLYFSSR